MEVEATAANGHGPSITDPKAINNPSATNTSPYHKYNPRTDLRDFDNYTVIRTIPVSTSSCAAVKFKRDGTQLATGSGLTENSSPEEVPVKVWDVETGQQTASLKGHIKGVSDVCWSHDNRLIASASDDRTIRIWDVASATCVQTLKGHTHDVTSCSFDPKGNVLASASMDETVRLWDVQNGRCIRVTPGHSDPVTYVDYSPVTHQDPLIVSASLDGISRVWSPLTGACCRSILNADNLPLSFSMFTPNARFILLGMIGGSLELWDYKDRVKKKVYKGHLNSYFCLRAAFLLNNNSNPKNAATHGGYVVCGSEDHHVYVWDLNEPRKQGPWVLRGKEFAISEGNGHYSTVLAVDTNPTQPMIASAAAKPDGSVKLWAPSHTAS